uniref:Signal peptidase complex subunit 2 n=1 Tax=Grammatophora oceanica TaxID=210454 RepID=A0A7S1V020_9STRA
MGRSSSSKNEETKQDDSNDEEEEEELELLQVDVGDVIKLKQILDETTSAAVLEFQKEDFRLDNMKLAIMTLACLFACLAQFAPIPFPDSRPVLGICCCIYFVLSGVLQAIVTFLDKDCILITKPTDARAQKSNPNLHQYGIRVRTDLPRFSEYYKVILEFEKMPNTVKVVQTWSVGNFFDVDGYFDEIGMTEAVQGLYKRLEKGEYDKDEDVVTPPEGSAKSKKE